MKRNISIILTVFIIFALSTACSRLAHIPQGKHKQIGVSLIGGKEIDYNRHWESKQFKFQGCGAKLLAENYFDRKEKWKIGIDGYFYRHKAKGNGLVQKAKTFGGDLYLKRELKFKILKPIITFIGIIGGFSHLTPRYNQPEWKDSGLIGKFGIFTGIEIPLSEKLSTEICYQVDHSSDPLNRGDMGRNVQSLEFIIKWKIGRF